MWAPWQLSNADVLRMGQADVMRFIMRCESKEDVQKAITLLKGYRPWYCACPYVSSPPFAPAESAEPTPAFGTRMPKLDVSAGSLLLRACLRCGDLDLALEVLHAHRQLRSSLSKTVCMEVLAALSKEGRTDDMLAAFSYMRTAQPAVVSPKSLGILLAGLGHKGQAAKAAEILLQTRAAGVKPKAFTYRCVSLSLLPPPPPPSLSVQEEGKEGGREGLHVRNRHSPTGIGQRLLPRLNP
jgi:hypothetical protein